MKPISQDVLIETLKSQGYKAFADEACRQIPLDKLLDLLYYKYGVNVTDWTASVSFNKLILKNIGGFEYTFPLV